MNQAELVEQQLGFPKITYREFLEIEDRALQQEIISKNKILRTDTYNRTMDAAKGGDWDKVETYTLQLRKSPYDYLIVTGLLTQIQQSFSAKVTQAELDFANEYYEKYANVPFFNKEKWQMVIDKYNGRLPLEIDGVPDGTAVLPGDPILRVTGPGELAAHLEADFHRVFYPSLVATTAREIAKKLGVNTVVEAGLRGAAVSLEHLIAVDAMYVGGGLFLTSDDSAAASLPGKIKDAGTLAHRFMGHIPSEEAAVRKALSNMDKVAPPVDLNNSIDGIDMILKLKKEFRDSKKIINMRLDSGDLAALAIYALNQQKELGFTDPLKDRVIISGVESISQALEINRQIREAGFEPEKFISYVIGHIITAEKKTRNDGSSGYKLTKSDGYNTMKHSDSPGKGSYPGEPTLAYVNGERLIAQKGEYPNNDLFVPLYRPETGVVTVKNGLDQARNRVESSFAQISGPTRISDLTRKMIEVYEKGGEGK